MKHTDFYALVRDIKRKEQQELRQALEAHGGSYSWWNSNTGDWENEYPIVAVNVDNMCPEPMDIIIRSVFIVDGVFCFDAENKEYGHDVEVRASDFFPGHLSFIIDYIPATEDVDDVTIPAEDLCR